MTRQPGEPWTTQIARNLTDCEDGFLNGKRFVLMDRDAKFGEKFRTTLRAAGVEPVRLPPRSPNLNAHIERFMRSIKEECLDRMIFFGERPLQHAVQQFVEHYHAERNHQGLDNRLIDPPPGTGSPSGEIDCRERLGGLLRSYHRRAA